MPGFLEDGINFFNTGQYFEAHEAWEDLWRQTRGPLRLFYQGLVQAAVGLHHLSRGNLDGARSQLTKSLEKLEQYPPNFCRIDNARLIEQLRQALSVTQAPTIRIVRLQ